MQSVLEVLSQRNLRRQPRMLQDPLMTCLTWADLEEAWSVMASPDNAPLVKDFVTALWKEAEFLPEMTTLSRILAATVLLTGPACFPGSEGGPDTQN